MSASSPLASTHPRFISEPCASRSRDSIEDIYGPRLPTMAGPWPTRIDSRFSSTPTHFVQSACVLCSNGCALDIGVRDGRIVGVRGRGEDRVNKGRLGPKGLHGWVANHSEDRLTHPLVRGPDGQLRRATWDEAMTRVVEKTREVSALLSNHGIAFYSTGQLFLEEYYALAVVGKAGLGSLHMDGNTRLCTATAATSMRESFGSDGQPGSYADVDVTDCLFIVGHNPAATQTVLWARMLDRMAGLNPPQVVVVDPRATTTAKSATLHLTPKVGTNVALLNGLQHLLLIKGYVNSAFVHRHTVGYADLEKVVAAYPPDVVSRVTGVPVAQLHAAADILGRTRTLLTTALQGVYQSNQATAAACQLNNINLLLGQIGKPGSGLLQMNGQPTAQNNRETGCNGEYPGFRNNLNVKHMEQIANHWGVELHQMPHWQESPTHVMEMLHYIESDSVEMLWVIGTNPLVSLPELERIRRLLTKPDLFVVVQDIFLTETAQLADVVLPAAMWGEKTGCFTNADRTCHLSMKAIDPPGEAKSDLDIFLDYGRRMGWKDKNGAPLLPWTGPEEVFESWKALSAGRPCDYSGMSYARLTGGSGMQWPCNPQTSPEGTERLFADWTFYTDMEYCESYGHDLETGASYTADEYRVMAPAGRAFLKAAHYQANEEMPSDAYPLLLSTGRGVYHFHTRTKTGRDRHLARAGGDSFVQLSIEDASTYGITDGDLCLVESARGRVEVRARVGGMEAGQVFLPFHFGYWDDASGRSRAANELTASVWDAVSKQPLFKSGAVRVSRVAEVERRGEKEEKVGPTAAPQLQTAAIHRAEGKLGAGGGTHPAVDPVTATSRTPC